MSYAIKKISDVSYLHRELLSGVYQISLIRGAESANDLLVYLELDNGDLLPVLVDVGDGTVSLWTITISADNMRLVVIDPSGTGAEPTLQISRVSDYDGRFRVNPVEFPIALAAATRIIAELGY